jgi:hypothetical protein
MGMVIFMPTVGEGGEEIAGFTFGVDAAAATAKG